MKKRAAIVAIIGILLFGTVVHVWSQAMNQESDQQVMRATFEKIFTKYILAVESFDADLWITNWDDNGVKMVPNAAPIVGKPAIGAFAKSKFGLFTFWKMRISIDKVYASGDLAVAQGTYTSEDQLKTATSHTLSFGWFCTTFKRQPDGTWKILTDCIGPIPSPSPAAK
jgi:ketosteroid isomerase-like protein